MVAILRDFYAEHQLLINLLVLGYGLLLAVAHYNLKSIHHFLLEQYETEDEEEALTALAREIDESIIDRIKQEFPFPLISSPFRLGAYRVSRRSLITVIAKKGHLSRQRMDELLTQVDQIGELKE